MKVVFNIIDPRSPMGSVARLVCAMCGMLLAGCSAHTSQALASAPRRAPSCTGACLAGLDPYDTGCSSDARTTARAPALDPSGHAVAVVELRRSKRCETSWARAMRVSDASGTLMASISAVGYSNSFEHATDGEVWTDMVPATRACPTATGGIRPHEGQLLRARATSCADASVGGLASE